MPDYPNGVSAPGTSELLLYKWGTQCINKKQRGVHPKIHSRPFIRACDLADQKSEGFERLLPTQTLPDLTLLMTSQGPLLYTSGYVGVWVCREFSDFSLIKNGQAQVWSMTSLNTLDSQLPAAELSL